MTLPPDTLLLWSAVAAVGLAFFGFAWLFVDAVDEGAGNYASTMGAETSRAFEDVFMFISPTKIARLGRLAALAAFFLFFIPLFSLSSAVSTAAGIALGLGAGLFTFTLPGRYVRFLRERRRIRFNEQLVTALGTMSNALRAGFSVNQAFESVVETGDKPISQEFSVFLQQLRVGMSFEDALASLDRRVASDDLTLVCTSIDIARRTGGNLTEIFDRISDTIRARMRIERRVRTLTAQGRMQGMIVSAMPLFLGIAMLVLKPEVMRPFVFSLKGAACIGVVLALVAVGWLIIRKIVRIEV
ncbi:MAG: type II secretion system F family protein [Kiritimatiellae bacterium]|nr:type II secretion system F family protein [Kiritimatiellia bacterium]